MDENNQYCNKNFSKGFIFQVKYNKNQFLDKLKRCNNLIKSKKKVLLDYGYVYVSMP